MLIEVKIIIFITGAATDFDKFPSADLISFD